jgi:hypothetical protein
MAAVHENPASGPPIDLSVMAITLVAAFGTAPAPRNALSFRHALIADLSSGQGR